MVDVGDVDAHDWDWWMRYGAEVQTDLIGVYKPGILAADPTMELGEAGRLAAQYAEREAGILLHLSEPANIVAETRRLVGQLVADTIEKGESLNTLTANLRKNHAFSRERARTIARTETARALGNGEMKAAEKQKRNRKRWFTQGDDDVSSACVLNEGAEWILIGDLFPSGAETIPEHPNCRCVVRYKTEAEPLKEGEFAQVAERENVGDGVGGLSEDQADEVNNYTGIDYRTINTGLRGRKRQEEIADKVNVLDEAIGRHGDVNLKERKLWRGVGDAEEIFGSDQIEELIGLEFADDAYMSTTTNASVAINNFGARVAGKRTAILEVVDARSDIYGLDIQDVSRFANESEVLLPRGLPMKIMGGRVEENNLFLQVLVG